MQLHFQFPSHGDAAEIDVDPSISLNGLVALLKNHLPDDPDQIHRPDEEISITHNSINLISSQTPLQTH